jgi:hypothetical protein
MLLCCTIGFSQHFSQSKNVNNFFIHGALHLFHGLVAMPSWVCGTVVTTRVKTDSQCFFF